MRDFILLHINGTEHRVSGAEAFLPLSSYLRYVKGAYGTKVVCEEGDCGACTVLVGKVEGDDISYSPINSCIQNVYQLDLRHVITIEGLKVDGELNCVQKSMVENQGAQCGFCTPGIVVAMCSLFDCKSASATVGARTASPGFDKKDAVTEQDVRDALTGNLCRCTGYEPIITAGLSVDLNDVVKLKALYPPKSTIETINVHKSISVMIEDDGKKFFAPNEIDQAVEFRSKNPGTVIIQGGTDVCVQMNKRGFDPQVIMSLCNLNGLTDLNVQNDVLVVGGRVTLAQLEEKVKELIPQLADMLWVFGSPQIKNAGTLAGNIVNASPIADTIPFLYVTDAEIDLRGVKGTRTVKAGSFYKGYKKLDLNADEIVTQIRIPLPKPDEILRLYKVSKRKNLDISTFTCAILLKKNADKIDSVRIAYGGVAPVVLRLPKTEQFLVGKPFSEETFEQAGKIAATEITPISDVRGEAEFRLALAQSIMVKFFYEVNEDAVVCQR